MSSEAGPNTDQPESDTGLIGPSMLGRMIRPDASDRGTGSLIAEAGQIEAG